MWRVGSCEAPDSCGLTPLPDLQETYQNLAGTVTVRCEFMYEFTRTKEDLRNGIYSTKGEALKRQQHTFTGHSLTN